MDSAMTVTGVEGLEPGESHCDLNGKWGGYKSWIVHFNSKENPSRNDLAIYRFVGWYFDAGRYAQEKRHTRMEVSTLVCDAMIDGVSVNWLFWINKIAIRVLRIFARKGRG